MHEQAPATDLLTEGTRPGDHVLEQPGADAAALVPDVDAQTGEKGDGLGEAAGALASSCRRLRRVMLAMHQA